MTHHGLRHFNIEIQISLLGIYKTFQSTQASCAHIYMTFLTPLFIAMLAYLVLQQLFLAT